MPTAEELKFLQSQTLERKIMITQTRIMEWYNRFEGKVYVSFSGGKDSTVLLDIARKMYPDIEAVFVDTGLEYPEIRDFVKTKRNVTWLRPEMRFDEVIAKYGYPIISKEVSQKIYEYRKNPGGCRARQFDPESDYLKRYGMRYSLVKWIGLRDSDIPISDLCCDVMKKKPAKQFEKKTGKKPILGTMATESALRRQSYLKSGCNGFDSKRPTSQPLGFWTEQDILEYLVRYELPYADIYGDIVKNRKDLWETTGEQRTGCMFCMFGITRDKKPNRFQRMKITHPKQWDYCINRLGCGRVLDFVGIPYGKDGEQKMCNRDML